MIYDLSTAAYDAIAEAFKDHLDGDFFPGRKWSTSTPRAGART